MRRGLLQGTHAWGLPNGRSQAVSSMADAAVWGLGAGALGAADGAPCPGQRSPRAFLMMEMSLPASSYLKCD